MQINTKLICFLILCLPVPGLAQDSYSQKIKSWLESQGYGDSLDYLAVNIFGDGDPANGIEDNRIDMSSPLWNSDQRRSWNMGAGTVHCDGRNRGSAVIVDTSMFGGLDHGKIIATSAHVLFNLETKLRFKACRFHFMAIDHLPGYQADIRYEYSLLGDFDPSSPRTSDQFGKEDWAFLYIDDEVPGISTAGSLKLLPFVEAKTVNDDDTSFQFIAWSRSADSISISTSCEIKESGGSDLGGGSWPGQLLDNCDSEGGASGGGLIARNSSGYYLVGIRSGSHWDGDTYPADTFPSGPPDGSTWDITKNTNFGRAIDRELIAKLQWLVDVINAKTKIVLYLQVKSIAP